MRKSPARWRFAALAAATVWIASAATTIPAVGAATSAAAVKTRAIAPTGVKVVSAVNRTVRLDWADNSKASPNFAYYTVRRSTRPDVTKTAAWTRLPRNFTASAAIDRGLRNGTKYYYYVTAVTKGARPSQRPQWRRRSQAARARVQKTVSARSAVVEGTPIAAAPAPAPAPAPSADGSLLWNGDFSTGDVSQYSSIVACKPDRVRVIRDPLGLARKAVSITAYDSDVAPCTPTSNPRAQIQSPSIIQQNKDYWIGHSTMVPTNFPSVTDWTCFGSTYGPPYGGTGPVGFCLDDTTIYWRRNATYNYDLAWSMPLVKGKWVDFAIHQHQSQDPRVGYVELWINTGNGWQQQLLKGQKRLYMKTVDSSNNGGTNHHTLSLYRNKGVFNVGTLFHADHKIGTSFNAVAPNSY